MSYRSEVQERDFSGFVGTIISETGGMVVVSSKGRGDKPILCQSEKDVILHFGNPSALYPSVFEAIAFCRKAPCYIAAAIGDGALYGGVTVTASEVTALSAGIASPSAYTFSGVTVSHVIVTASPFDDNYSIVITSLGGSKFKALLYETINGTSFFVKEYNYSLIREKDNFGKSLYFGDVFDNDPYLIFIFNSSNTVTSYTLTSTIKVAFGGGARGAEPESSDIVTAWNLFQKANKYPVQIFMDALGGNAGTLNTLIQTYQPYAQGISVVPMGSDVSEMTTFRSGLSLDTDDVCLYCNWTKIKDSYNNSMAWISNVGSIGKKYAQMSDVYDALSPAGLDEDGHGGQLSDWAPVEVECDFSDNDLQSLDEAQINPIIFDEVYGLMIYGDKTLQASLSDTSYVGTRRLYKLIIKNIVRQVLRKQEFKNNDDYHRFKAQAMTEDFLRPILALQLLTEAVPVCDLSNNDDVEREQRHFVLDIYVKVTPNSQKCILRLTRLSQTQTVAEFLAA